MSFGYTNIYSISHEQEMSFSYSYTMLLSDDIYTASITLVKTIAYRLICLEKVVPTYYAVEYGFDATVQSKAINPTLVIGLVFGVCGGILLLVGIFVFIYRKLYVDDTFSDNIYNSDDSDLTDDAERKTNNEQINPLYDALKDTNDPFADDFVDH